MQGPASPEVTMAPRYSYCRNCFLLPSGENRCVCSESHALPAQPSPWAPCTMAPQPPLNESLVFAVMV